MKAIQIRLLPATNFKGVRVKAFSEGGNSIILPYQYELSSYTDQAQEAAQEFINRMNWNVEISGIGMLPNGDYAVTLK